MQVGSVTTWGKKPLCSLVVQLVRWQKCELTVAGLVAVFDNDLGSVHTTHHTDIIDAVLSSFIPSPIFQFYSLYSLYFECSLARGVVEIFPPWNGTTLQDPHTSSFKTDGVHLTTGHLQYGFFSFGDFSCATMALLELSQCYLPFIWWRY